MARGRSWADDSTTQIKFAGGGSVTVAFHGNFFDLTKEERQLIDELSDVTQKFQQTPADPQMMAEEKKWP